MSAILPPDKSGRFTVPEQIQMCRQNAQEAEQLAAAAHSDLKAEYKRIAAEWLKIAAELEQWGTAKISIPTEIG